jgi:hypothetical protein
MRKQVVSLNITALYRTPTQPIFQPPEKTKDVLDFATKKPMDRLQSIKNGLNVIDWPFPSLRI